MCLCAVPDSLLQVEIYRDEDKARQEDIASLKVTDEAFAGFYERVKDLREYHKKHSTYDVTEVGTCRDASHHDAIAQQACELPAWQPPAGTYAGLCAGICQPRGLDVPPGAARVQAMGRAALCTDGICCNMLAAWLPTLAGLFL